MIWKTRNGDMVQHHIMAHWIHLRTLFGKRHICLAMHL